MRKQRLWLLNVLIIFAVIACILAFAAHSKNWTRVRADHISLLSGIFYKEISFSELDSVQMVPRIPQMERVHGFSAWAMEKGIFLDSLHPENRVSVYVDNLMLPKIRIVHNDSLHLFLNFTDSLETNGMYLFLLSKVESDPKTKPD